MLLQNKNAVIYGASGGIGGAMARAFAADGARVFLTGRTREKLDALAAEIGDAAEVANFDATDKRAVDEHADAVAAQGGLHVSVNVIAHPTKHGTPMVEMDVDEFLQPVEQAVRSNFLTTAAAARHMKKQGDGVILFFGGHGDPVRDYYLGGTQVAFEALESMRRQLSAELGKDGIRCRDAAQRRRSRLGAGIRRPGRDRRGHRGRDDARPRRDLRGRRQRRAYSPRRTRAG